MGKGAISELPMPFDRTCKFPTPANVKQGKKRHKKRFALFTKPLLKPLESLPCAQGAFHALRPEDLRRISDFLSA